MSSIGMDEQWGVWGCRPGNKEKAEKPHVFQPPSKCFGTLREQNMGGY